MARRKALNQKTRDAIVEFAKDYGARVMFTRLRAGDVAHYLPKTGFIVIDKYLDPEEALSSFFHEVGHLNCFRAKRFPAFHRRFVRSWAQVYALRRTALQAELWVDRWAEREFNKRVRGKFVRSYRCSESRQALKNYCNTITPLTSRG